MKSSPDPGMGPHLPDSWLIGIVVSMLAALTMEIFKQLQTPDLLDTVVVLQIPGCIVCALWAFRYHPPSRIRKLNALTYASLGIHYVVYVVTNHFEIAQKGYAGAITRGSEFTLFFASSLFLFTAMELRGRRSYADAGVVLVFLVTIGFFLVPDSALPMVATATSVFTALAAIALVYTIWDTADSSCLMAAVLYASALCVRVALPNVPDKLYVAYSLLMFLRVGLLTGASQTWQGLHSTAQASHGESPPGLRRMFGLVTH